MRLDSVSAILTSRLNAVLRSDAYRAADLRALSEAHRLRRELDVRVKTRIARISVRGA